MGNIKIESNPPEDKLDKMGVTSWPIWEKEASEFPWHYDDTETCYLLEGEVEVINENGVSFHFQKNDLVTFPEGMSCTWKIKKSVRKHYNFG